jgi:hypothetical protein
MVLLHSLLKCASTYHFLNISLLPRSSPGFTGRIRSGFRVASLLGDYSLLSYCAALSRRFIARMMEVAHTSETSVYCNETTRFNTPEGSKPHTRRCEFLKSHINLLGRREVLSISLN